MTTRHTIEERVGVYLTRNEQGVWEIDPVTMDGEPLDGLEFGPANHQCQCGDPVACERALNAARELPLPTGRELAAMFSSSVAQLDEYEAVMAATYRHTCGGCRTRIAALDGAQGPVWADEWSRSTCPAAPRGDGPHAPLTEIPPGG